MKNTAHTPTPWRVKQDEHGNWCVFGPPHKKDGGDYAPVAHLGRMGQRECRLIVRAVNHHADLVAFAERVSRAPGFTPNTGTPADVLERMAEDARALLAKVGGRMSPQCRVQVHGSGKIRETSTGAAIRLAHAYMSRGITFYAAPIGGGALFSLAPCGYPIPSSIVGIQVHGLDHDPFRGFFPMGAWGGRLVRLLRGSNPSRMEWPK